MTDEADPTQEIRTLINELQTVARDARGQLMGMELQRDDAVRQLNEALRRCEESDRRTEEAVVQLAAVQKQVLSIRQARDAAQAQNLAIAAKLLRADDEIAELGDAREAAQQAAGKAARETADLSRQLEAVARDRDAALKQIGNLRSELDEQRRKVLGLTEQKSAVAEAGSAHATALAEARAQLLSLTQERDAERNRANEQAREAEAARQRIGEMHAQATTAVQTAVELDESKRQLAALLADRELHLEHEEELLAETVAQQERLAAVTDELAAAHRECQEARDHAERYEQRRLQSIDLAAQLAAARCLLLKTSADLAEARLQVRIVQGSK